MARNKLTDTRIRNLKQPGKYGDGGGLWFVVTKGGTANWCLRYERDGREHMMGLGAYPVVSLSAAREKALEAHRKLDAGIDPIAERRAAKEAAKLATARSITFAEAAEKWHADNSATWTSAKYAREVLTALQRMANPVLGAMDVRDIASQDIVRALKGDGKTTENHWKNTPRTAAGVRTSIEAVLGWAKGHGYREGENPAVYTRDMREALGGSVAKLNRAKTGGERKGHPALPWGSMPALWAELAEVAPLIGKPAAALQLCILTGVRRQEVLYAQWSEFDLEERIWRIPAARMKVKGAGAHVVPLSSAALAVLAGIRRTKSPFLFPGSRGADTIGPNEIARALSNLPTKWMGTSTKGGAADKPATTHGFRSTFRDWALEDERHSWDRELVEMCLAHEVGNAVELAYKRGSALKKRAAIMEAWGAYVLGQDVPTATVIPLRSA